jgi:hypothetical protein
MKYALAAVAIATMVPVAAAQHNHGATLAAAPPDGSAVTVTGCLARGPAAGTFVLNNVTWQSANTPTGTAAAPATKPSSAPPAAESLRLGGAASTLKLDAHVGHTISATGTLLKRDPVVTPGIVLPDPQPQGDTTSRARDAEERNKDAQARAAASLRTLDMRSMSHVATECK